MPAEMLVAAAAAMAKTEAWAEGFSNSVSLMKTVSSTLSNVYNSYEVTHNGGSNGHIETTSELSLLKCSKCQYIHTECQCEQFVESLSHQLGPAYCPNPNDSELPREYETHVQIFVRVPEMVPVDKTFYKKEVCYEERIVSVPTSRIVEDEVEHTELVPVVKMVPKTRTEICYRVTKEEIEVTEMVFEVEYEDVCRIESRPRVITEDCEETIMVPVVKEVPVTRVVEEWTGRYCESEVEKFCSPGDFNLICEDNCHQHGSGHMLHHKPSRSSASSVSGDSPSHHKKRSSKEFSRTESKDLVHVSADVHKGLLVQHKSM